MSSAISIKSVSKSYGSKLALNKLSFEVPSGTVFGFLGPNGAGKTTTIRCLMNFMSVDKGSIMVLDQPVSLSNYKLRSQIGYLPSNNNLYPHWSVKDHLKFIAKSRNVKLDFDLTEKLDLDLESKVGDLSTGNHQKLMIAIAFCGEPSLLILDEPTKGLDPILQNLLYDLLVAHRLKGGTAFMSSHNLSEVERVCDAIAVIKDGKIIVEETLESLRSKNLHEINVTFKEVTPEDFFKSFKLEVISHHERSWQLKLKGDINPLISLLNKQPISDITIDHASLEEIFLDIYK